MATDNLFSAGDSALGYLYQCRLALVESIRRIRSKVADAVSIESLDDISFDKGDSPAELLQAKHHINAADLSNYSPDIWKSIRIWLTFHRDQGIPFEEIDHFLVTTAAAQDDTVAIMLARQLRDVQSATRQLREVASVTTNRDNRPGAQMFEALTETEQEKFVASVYILTSQPSIVSVVDDLKRELLLNVSEEHVEPFLDRVEGWWFRQCVNHLASSSRDPIALKSIHSQIVDITGQFEEQNLPVDLYYPEPNDVDSDTRVFVQQLRIIGLSSNAIEQAIRNYYRAFTNRSKWNREDLLLVGELEQYERKLVEEWEQLFELIRQDVKDLTEDAAIVKGRELFTTMHFHRHYRIRPKVDEESIYRGSLHMLADDRRVGWHLSFRERLSELLEVATS